MLTRDHQALETIDRLDPAHRCRHRPGLDQQGWRPAQGASMVTRDKRALEVLEAAATIPVMLLILVAVINLGMAVYAQQAVQNAANYGARMGSTAQPCRACTAYGAAASSIAGSGVQNASVEILAPGVWWAARSKSG